SGRRVGWSRSPRQLWSRTLPASDATVEVTARAGRGQDRARVLTRADLRAGAVRGDPVPDPLRDLDRRDRRRVALRGAGARRPLGAAAQRLEDLGDLRLVEGLLVEELEHQRVQDVA